MRERPTLGDLFDRRAAEREAVIESFEMAWQSGDAQDLSDYSDRVDLETFVEIVHIDLEQRIKVDAIADENGAIKRLDFEGVAAEPEPEPAAAVAADSEDADG